MYVAVTPGELPAVAALMNRAYRGTGASAGWNTEAAYVAGDRTTADLLAAELAAKPAALLLKWVEDGADSFAGCVWLEELVGGTWYLGSLAIAPERQNGGLGRAMLAAAERRVGEHGGRQVRMTVVNVRDALIAWYIRRGYARTGETEPFPYDDERFGRPLRDDLYFVVLEKAIR